MKHHVVVHSAELPCVRSSLVTFSPQLGYLRIRPIERFRQFLSFSTKFAYGPNLRFRVSTGRFLRRSSLILTYLQVVTKQYDRFRFGEKLGGSAHEHV
jgi:hypothetical protein